MYYIDDKIIDACLNLKQIKEFENKNATTFDRQ